MQCLILENKRECRFKKPMSVSTTFPY